MFKITSNEKHFILSSRILASKKLVKNNLTIKQLISSIPKKYLKNLKFKLANSTPDDREAYYQGNQVYLLKEALNYYRFDWALTDTNKIKEENPKIWSISSRGNQFGIKKKGDYQKEYLQHIIAHEVGHHVLTKILTEEQINKIVKSKAFKNYKSDIVNTYADHYSKRAEEDSMLRKVLIPKRMKSEKIAEMFREFIINKKYSNLFK